MKYDMCGGAAMLGAMAGDWPGSRPSCKVIAVVPSSENMPGGRAQKPGDVQIAMTGKSIEVINTDAEGPPGSGGCRRLREAAWLHAPGRRRHA